MYTQIPYSPKVMELTFQLKSDSSSFGRYSETEPVVHLQVLPPRPHPVDRLLPQSHLQRMKKLLRSRDRQRS
jgi:hypothetical protein